MQTIELIKTSFYINDRYFINPNTNVVMDKMEKKETRLEPRIMEVLCLLVAKAGHTSSREEIIASIWRDYGGGDDGLTQAISALRKLFADNQKELIQTIPKKGYCFNGQISWKKLPSASKKNKKWSAAAVVILSSLLVLFLIWSRKEKVGDQQPSFTQVAYPGNNWENDSLEHNDQNTIVTYGPDSTLYRLVIIGDQPPQFYINNNFTPTHQWEPYQPLINKLKKLLQEKKNSKVP